MAELFALYEQGKIKPRISETLKMQDAATALNLVQDRKALGKIVLTND
jgi:NADPH2:quinone reductase